MYCKTTLQTRVFQKEAIQASFGAKIHKGREFKSFGDELILDILELQMKSKKKGHRRRY